MSISIYYQVMVLAFPVRLCSSPNVTPASSIDTTRPGLSPSSLRHRERPTPGASFAWAAKASTSPAIQFYVYFFRGHEDER